MTSADADTPETFRWWLRLQVGLMLGGGAVAVAGLITEEDFVVGAAVGLLAGGLVLRFGRRAAADSPAARGRREAAAEGAGGAAAEAPGPVADGSAPAAESPHASDEDPGADGGISGLAPGETGATGVHDVEPSDR